MAKFKARARALDMLGRQQIAGIPTALNELFKNAHDAYADNVVVDFFRKHNLLLLRDDGIGMTKEDFEERWLTLGTESKLATAGGIKSPLKKKGKKDRPVMGEKGIGRLAIAAIGPQTLVLTKAANGPKKKNPIVAAFINWSMFELPGIDLSEVEIPIKEFSSVEEITKDEVESLVRKARSNIEALASRTSKELVTNILNNLAKFTPEIESLLDLSLGPSLKGANTGTQFYVSPVNEILKDDIDGTSLPKDEATNLQKMLLGFSNTLDFKKGPVLQTQFRDHLVDGRTEERAGYQEFFTQEEYDLADHHLQGGFNEEGVFEGTLSIFDAKPIKIKINCNPRGHDMSCGPFSLNFGYLQGRASESLAPEAEHATLAEKLKKLGGLYIYKDGIRVLPYGGPEFDFLELEKKRTEYMGYFFSFRRMLGTIDLSRKNNSRLEEKAGREGFQSTKPYREFKDVLKVLFDSLYSRYFSKSGEYSDNWKKRRASLDTEFKAQKERRENVNKARKKLRKQLLAFSKAFEAGSLEKETELFIKNAIKMVEALLNKNNLEVIAEEIIDLELLLEADLENLKDKYIIKKPKAVGLDKKLNKQWLVYEERFDKFVEPLFKGVGKQLRDLVGRYAKEAKVIVNAKKRLSKMLEQSNEDLQKNLDSKKEALQEALNIVSVTVDEAVKEKQNKINSLSEEIYSNIEVSEFSKMSAKQIEDLRNKIMHRLEKASFKMDNDLEEIESKLLQLSPGSEISYLTSNKAVAALEAELEMLREDYKSSLEMAQLGMAVSVIHHEFESNVKSIRNSLRVLSKWANKNETLMGVYERIRDSFDHLDNYLNLFTPLDRRLRKRKTTITGEAIEDFVKSLFEERLERHNVELRVTAKFRLQKISSYASTVYPAFINVIDNAFYWLDQKDDPSVLTLDATENGFSISDNGPGVDAIDRDYIFDYGYTRKSGGRGMGLYIAKTALTEEGLDISLDKKFKSGAKFIISKIEG